MLSAIREIRANGITVERTPLLVPSFSSKGFWDIQKVYETVQSLIDRPILISAYDIFHEKIRQPSEPVGLLFLDSGGYEASKDGDFSDYGDYTFYAQPWGREKLQEVIASWKSPEPTVFVSYDHPAFRVSIADQIRQAQEFLPTHSLVVREILIKPENVDQQFLDIAAILPHAAKLAEFDLIGLTEKELGRTTAERMRNIAELRRKLDSLGAATPIHIFGSLDTFNTTLYFVSGADVFDGLTWLRFSFSEGQTIYKYVHASLKYGLSIDIDDIDPSCWSDNYQYMRQMERDMRRYVHEKSFDMFRWHSESIETAFHEIIRMNEDT